MSKLTRLGITSERIDMDAKGRILVIQAPNATDIIELIWNETDDSFELRSVLKSSKLARMVMEPQSGRCLKLRLVNNE